MNIQEASLQEGDLQVIRRHVKKRARIFIPVGVLMLLFAVGAFYLASGPETSIEGNHTAFVAVLALMGIVILYGAYRDRTLYKKDQQERIRMQAQGVIERIEARQNMGKVWYTVRVAGFRGRTDERRVVEGFQKGDMVQMDAAKHSGTLLRLQHITSQE